MTQDFLLTTEGIDHASEQVAAFLDGTVLGPRESMACRLTFEHALLMLRDYSGDGAPARLAVSKLLGRPRLMVMVRGKKFDPLAAENDLDEESMVIGRAVLEASGMRPTYSYRGGQNTLTLVRPRPPLSSLAQILIAFAAGLVVAAAGTALLGDQDLQHVIEAYVTPLFNVYLGMLGGIAGPLVFLSIANGICDIGDVATLGRAGKSLAGRFMRSNVAGMALAMVVCVPLFALPVASSSSAGDLVADLLGLVVGLLPTNVFAPFVEGNTSQIILLGIFVGIAALVLGASSEGVRTNIRELNGIAQFLMEQLCRFIPGFIFVMILMQAWSGTLGSMLSAWMPLVLCVVLMCAQVALQLVYVCLHRHVSLRATLAAIWPSMIVGLTTASSSAAYSTMLAACTDGMGVPKDHTSFSMPLGVVLCKCSTSVMCVVLMLYSMSTYGLGADLSWYVRLALASVLYAVVAPPVPGGMLMCYGLMLAELGIPAGALAIMTAADVMLDYPATFVRIGAMMLETLDSACALGIVDRTKLAKE